MGRQDQLQDFHRFPFDDDQRWSEYLSRVEISNPSPSVLLRLKARWYKRTVDPNFDVTWLDDAGSTPSGSTPTSNAAKFSSYVPPAAASTQQPATQQRSQPSTDAPPSAGTHTSTGSPRLPGTLAQQRYLFLYHIGFLLLCVVHMVPIVPSLSMRAYRMAMHLTALGQGYTLYAKYGLPPVRPWSWPRLQQYLTPIIPSSTFHFLVVGVAFASHVPITVVLLPLVALALQGALEYAAVHHSSSLLWRKLGARLQGIMRSKQREVAAGSAFAEVAVGIFLLLGLIGRSRNLILTFMYWNLLKSRYHISDAASQHRLVWAFLGQRAAPYLARVPPLQRAVGYVERWFTSAPQR